MVFNGETQCTQQFIKQITGVYGGLPSYKARDVLGQFLALADQRKYTAIEIYRLLMAHGPLLVAIDWGGEFYNLTNTGSSPLHTIVITGASCTSTSSETPTVNKFYYFEPFKGETLEGTPEWLLAGVDRIMSSQKLAKPVLGWFG